MKKKDHGFTRREFIKGAAGIALAGTAAAGITCTGHTQEKGKKPPPGPEQKEKAAEPSGKRALVVLVRDAKAVDEAGKPEAEVLARMLDEGVKALLGEKDAAAAWKRLVKPGETVGIKSNVWRFLPTPPCLEAAIRDRLVAVGVDKDRIGVDDRGVLRNPIFKEADALVNVRPLRTHHWSGVGSLIKNYIMFHPVPSSWHADSCANLAGLWDLPRVKGKTRLNILVLLTPLFHGKGPHHFQARYTWPYKGLLLGLDPVAVDATGVRILEAKRTAYFGEAQPFAVPPKHIQVAEKKFHLGVADPARITVKKLGWKEGALI